MPTSGKYHPGKDQLLLPIWLDWKDATALVVSGGRCPGAVERPSSAGRVLAPSLSSPCAFPLCDRESSLRTDTRSLAGGSENG